MKNIFLILCLLSGLVQLQAQEGVKAGLHFSYGFASIGSGDFQDFRRSYNSLLASNPNVESDLGGFNLGYSYSLGLMVGWDAVFVEIDYFKQRQRSTLRYSTGEYRRFEYRRTGGGWYMGLGHRYLNVGFGLEVGRNIINSSFTYGDGSTSFGEELALNGIYEKIGLPAFVGLRAAVPVTRFAEVRLKFDWFPGNNNGGVGFDYNDDGKGFSENFPTLDALPLDIEGYFANPRPTTELETIDAAFRIFRLEFGLSVTFAEE